MQLCRRAEVQSCLVGVFSAHCPSRIFQKSLTRKPWICGVCLPCLHMQSCIIMLMLFLCNGLHHCRDSKARNQTLMIMADQHLTDLEKERQARIARNQAILAQFEVPAAVQQLAQGIAAEAHAQAQAKQAARHAVLQGPAGTRASSRRQAAKAAAQKLAACAAAATGVSSGVRARKRTNQTCGRTHHIPP